MTHPTRTALAAAVLAGAMALAGCQHDSATAPTAGSAQRVSAGSARLADAPPSAPDGPIALADAEDGRSWTDADGHVYSVLFGVGGGVPTVSHYRDGSLFAQSRQEQAGSTVTTYVEGLVLDEQFVQVLGPQGLRAFTDDPVARRPADRDGGQPLRAMQPLCADEIRGYIIASGEMIIAGALMQRYPNRKSRTGFTIAVANFASAWRSLYQCEQG